MTAFATRRVSPFSSGRFTFSVLLLVLALALMLQRTANLQEERDTEVKHQLERQGYTVVSVAVKDDSEGTAVLKTKTGSEFVAKLYATTVGSTPYLLCPVSPSGKVSGMNCTGSP